MYSKGLLIVGKMINDVSTSVQDHLSISDIISDALRSIGDWLYQILGTFVNGLDNVFQELVKVDLSTMINLGDLKITLNEVTWYLLLISLLGTIVLKMFSTKVDLTFLRNLFLIIVSITIFTSFTSFMSEVKDSGMVIINDSLGKNENTTMSEKVFRDNSYDMLQSVNKNTLKKVNENMKIDRIQINSILSKGELQGKYDTDDTGNEKIVNLKDGVNGIGDERYYKYDINYTSINITLVMLVIFYAIGGFKICYIMWDLFFANILGTAIMAKGVNNIKKVAEIFSYVAKSVATFLITYGSMIMFSNVISSIFASNVSWFAKIILIFSFGMVTLIGSGFITKLLGFDDGSAFLMKLVFMGRSLSRMGKNMVKGVSGLTKSGSDIVTNVGSKAYNGASGLANKMIDKSESRKMKEDMNNFVRGNQEKYQNPKIENRDKQLGNRDVIYSDNKTRGEKLPQENHRMIGNEKGEIYREQQNDKNVVNGTDSLSSSKENESNKNSVQRNNAINDEIESKNPYKKTSASNMESDSYTDKANETSKENRASKGEVQGNNPYYKKSVNRKSSNSNNTLYGNQSSMKTSQQNKGYKSTDNYKYAKGKSYNSPYEKKLPSWYDNEKEQSKLVDTSDFDENELARKMEQLKNKKY